MTSTNTDWLRLINPQVHEVWSGTWSPRNVEPARRLVDHELVLFEQGECELEIRGQRIATVPGTFVIVPPGQLHVTRAGNSRVLRHCVHFDWSPLARPTPTMLWRYAPTALDHRAVHSAPPWVPRGLISGSYKPGDRRLDRAIKQLIRGWSAGDAMSRATARASMLEVLILLLSPRSTAAPPQRSLNSNLAFEVRALMDRRRPTDGSVRTVLASLGFSYEYLCRCFTVKFGISPLRYANNIRLERARRLLEDESLKISAVGKLAGYSDAGYFIRCFRAYTGLSPARYAMKHREAMAVS